jgi:hypothetical protein
MGENDPVDLARAAWEMHFPALLDFPGFANRLVSLHLGGADNGFRRRRSDNSRR